jgi:hypothetical protein
MPHRYSTVARLDLAAIRPRPPDLDGHPALRLWLISATEPTSWRGCNRSPYVPDSSSVLGIGCGETRSRHRPIAHRGAMRPAPTAWEPSRAIRDRPSRVPSWTPRCGSAHRTATASCGHPSPGSRRAAGRVGVSHATARPSGARARPAAGRSTPARAQVGVHQPARTPRNTNATQEGHDGVRPPPQTPAAPIHKRAGRTQPTPTGGGRVPAGGGSSGPHGVPEHVEGATA